jgi:hypothetical protein
MFSPPFGGRKLPPNALARQTLGGRIGRVGVDEIIRTEFVEHDCIAREHGSIAPVLQGFNFLNRFVVLRLFRHIVSVFGKQRLFAVRCQIAELYLFVRRQGNRYKKTAGVSTKRRLVRENRGIAQF